MKKIFIPMFLFFATMAFAQSTSQLYAEFLQREQMKLSLYEGSALQFLKNVAQYQNQNIIDIEILTPNTSFVFQDRNGDVCLGDSATLMLRCKSEMGFTSYTYVADTATSPTVVETDPGSMPLYDEYLRRNAIQLPIHANAAVQYLKAVVMYDIRNIVELEVLNPESTFVFRDRSGDICFGDISKRILRCKNEMGITGVTYQGDAD